MILLANNCQTKYTIRELVSLVDLKVTDINIIATTRELSSNSSYIWQCFYSCGNFIKFHINDEIIYDGSRVAELIQEYRVMNTLRVFEQEQRRLLNEFFQLYGKPDKAELEFLKSDALYTACQRYDVTIGQTLCPVLKLNMWESVDDFKRKVTMVNQNDRLKYVYKITILDRLNAWMSLKYFSELQDEQFIQDNIVITDGVNYIITEPTDFLPDDFTRVGRTRQGVRKFTAPHGAMNVHGSIETGGAMLSPRKRGNISDWSGDVSDDYTV